MIWFRLVQFEGGDKKTIRFSFKDCIREARRMAPTSLSIDLSFATGTIPAINGALAEIHTIYRGAQLQQFKLIVRNHCGKQYIMDCIARIISILGANGEAEIYVHEWYNEFAREVLNNNFVCCNNVTYFNAGSDSDLRWFNSFRLIAEKSKTVTIFFGIHASVMNEQGKREDVVQDFRNIEK